MAAIIANISKSKSKICYLCAKFFNMRNFLFLLMLFALPLVGFGQIDQLLKIGTSTTSNTQSNVPLDANLVNQMQGQGNYFSPVAGAVTDTISNTEDVMDSVTVELDSVQEAIRREKAMKTIYGKSLFEQSNLKIFNSATHLRAPDEYVLGAGDEISISIWGFSEVSEMLKITDDGSAQAKLIGKLYLNGLSLAEARKLIVAKYGTVYDLKNSQISVQINYAKVIKVNIVGEVNIPGTYSVSAINSAFNVLSIAGGITELGSVRNICIKRDNKVVKILDVYSFLQNPSFSNDFFLKNNDYIIVQPAGKTVTISGAIGREGLYELTKEEGLAELVKIAGNLKHNAFTKTATSNRIENNRWVTRDLDLGAAIESKKMVAINNGDVINIASINEEIQNFVEVTGALNLAGKFEFIKGEKVSELIARAQGLQREAYTGRAYLIRTFKGGTKKYFKLNLQEISANPSDSANLVLQEFDVLNVFSSLDFFDEYFVEVVGAVRHDAKVAYSQNLTLQDMIFYGGGLKNEAANKRIEISRFVNFSENNESDEPISVIVETYEIANDLDLQNLNEVKLRPGDKVIVRLTADFSQMKYVVLQGKFKYPGTYVLLSSEETIKDVVERAGGFSEGAFLQGATMTRIQNNRGKVIVDLYKLYKRNKKRYNYVMLDGDTLIVPEIDDLVFIEGEIGSKVVSTNGEGQNAPYVKGRRAKYFVDEFAGGFSEEADRGSVYVISKSGKVKKSKNYYLFKTYPKVHMGDRIQVGKKIEKEEREKLPLDVNTLIGDLTAKATGILTLIVFINKLF